MGLLIKRVVLLSAAIMSCLVCNAQNSVEEYNRSSLYAISIMNTGTAYAPDIFNAMLCMQHPQRYNDHNLSLRVLQSVGDPGTKGYRSTIDKFLSDNQIAKRMVSKWFNRDKSTGAFNMDLVRQRGNYNATAEDVILANHTMRGTAMLEDAGEQLIGNTFVIVNEISYIDKEARSTSIAAVFQGLSYLAATTASIASISNSSSGKKVSDAAAAVGVTAALGGVITDNIAGFSCKIHSYLYRLVWDDETSGKFYNQYYYDSTQLDNSKKTAYLRDFVTFRLEYVGDYQAKSSKTVLKGLHSPSEVFNKVLSRTIDENIVQLQIKFPVFQVRATVFDVTADNKVLIHVGLKEGLNPSSKYEVLERREDEMGCLTYRRVAMLSPDKNLIWDNRCYAAEEEADNSGLKYSTFDITSGSGVLPGMLVREVR